MLRVGDHGDAVRDVQHRLVGTGHGIDAGEFGTFGRTTERAVREFQESRSIRIDGVVGPETWGALVESSFQLGDRLLFLRTPNLRGDDDAELQRTLNRLGFDAGREDGILGPETAGALREYQRNAGLSVDGVAGPATLDAVRRVESLAGGSVAQVREREELRRPSELAGRRIYLAVAPGFDQIGTAVRQSLERHQAQVMHDLSGATDSTLAERANRWKSHLVIALRAGDAPTWQCLYYASGEFRSERGAHAAGLISEELARVCPSDRRCEGKAYAMLRETRMATVVCALGDDDPQHLADLLVSSAELGQAIGRGIRRCFEEPGAQEPAAAEPVGPAEG
jgi:N-acetylmuramoyl-L-alanine amidase